MDSYIILPAKMPKSDVLLSDDLTLDHLVAQRYKA